MAMTPGAIRQRKKPGEALPVSVGIAEGTPGGTSTTAENYARRIVPTNPLTGKPEFTGQPGQYAYTPNRDLVSAEEYNRIAASVRPAEQVNIQPTPAAVPPVQPASPITAEQQAQAVQIFKPQLGPPAIPQAQLEQEAITAVQAGTATPGQQALYGRVSGEVSPVTAEEAAMAIPSPRDVALVGGLVAGAVLKGIGKVGVEAAEIAAKEAAKLAARKETAKLVSDVARTGIEGTTEAAVKASTGNVIVYGGGKAVVQMGGKRMASEATEQLKVSYLRKLLTSAKNPNFLMGLLGTYGFSTYMAFNKRGDAIQSLNIAINQAEQNDDLETSEQLNDLLKDIKRLNLKNILLLVAPIINYPISEIRAADAIADAAETSVERQRNKGTLEQEKTKLDLEKRKLELEIQEKEAKLMPQGGGAGW